MSCVLQPYQVSAGEAARIASGSLQRLIAQKRLVLVLDLDHTLLNTGAAGHMPVHMHISVAFMGEA